MKKCISILLVLVVLLQVSAQPPKQYTFTHYSTATGLQSNQVNAVVQDETGYMWMATTEGLVRFDGTRYKTFQHNSNDPFSIPSNAILQLLTDKKKNLWVLTTNGRAGIFNTKNFSFRPAIVKPQREASLKSLFKTLITDEYGNVFILFGGNEILVWDEKQNSFIPSNNFLPVKEGWKFSGFAQQPGTQKYWMGIQGGGLAIYNKATGKLSYAGNNVENEPAIENLSNLSNLSSLSNFFFDSKGGYWFVSGMPELPYVYRYDVKNTAPIPERHEFFSLLKTYNEIHGFYEQRDGTIWIKGLNILGRYLETEKRFELVPAGYENEKGIDYRTITCLFEDREMNVWVGTAINGIFRFNPSQEFFTNIRYTNRVSGKNGDNGVLSFSLENDGTLLVGTLHDGLFRYNKEFNIVPLGIKGIPEKNFINIRDMYRSRDSNITWFATQPGLYKYNSRQRSATHYNPAILADRSVRQIAEDKNGNLWLGMETKGVFKWNAEKGKTKFDTGLSKFEAIPSVKINNITIDLKGWVWIATAAEGLYVINPDTDSVLMHFPGEAGDEQFLKEDGITALLEYNDSLMLVTTTARILIYNRHKNSISALGSPENISGTITSLQKDNNGNLWISTTTALYRVTIKTRVFVRFNRDDGITNDYFIISASYKLPDGRMLFGAVGQFTVFNPAAILISTSPPGITITDFKVMNTSLLVDSLMQLKQIELGYEDNSLSVDFSTLAYISANIIQYKMKGIDKEWNTADKNNQAIYSYLPPGKYELQFETIDADGRVKLSSLQLVIKINPPFWKTWWFYSSLVLLTGGLLFWLDKTRMKRKETVQKMRSNIAGNLHEEVNTALNNINILSEMAKLKADREPQKSKEFIEQIHSKSHNMIIAMDDMLWSISPDNDSMEKTVARMQEYIDALNNRRGANIEMLVDDKVKLLNLDMQFRHEAFLLFKESIIGLSNAAAAECKIHVALEKSALLYSINFNNEGSDRQQLTNMLERLETSKHAAAINARLNLQIHASNSVLEIKMLVG
ncbi:MAG TPA: two-component regulator propeller domain-containing protein [Chitinophagaceae bacterium]|nr:two-component regulator propeller domain-containing protein [Chitinophagaceae bacterium]